MAGAIEREEIWLRRLADADARTQRVKEEKKILAESLYSAREWQKEFEQQRDENLRKIRALREERDLVTEGSAEWEEECLGLRTEVKWLREERDDIKLALNNANHYATAKKDELLEWRQRALAAEKGK